MRSKKKTGFTLAEVLITLIVIGIISAMTIPTFIANHQKTIYVTSLKKFVASFDSGIQKYMGETGCVGDLSCTGMFKYSTWHGSAKTLLDTMIKPTFNVVKTCAHNDSSCVGGPIYTITGKTNQYTDPGWSAGETRTYRYLTSDGMLVWMFIGDLIPVNCKYIGDSSSKLTPICAGIAVDINGAKPPNVFGRDYFVLYLANNGLLYPRRGVEDAKFMCGSNIQTCAYYWRYNATYCPKNSPSIGCAARIMEEGWEMTY